MAAPLRDALDWLRDWIAPLYENLASALLNDPWEARDDYISVILDRSPETRERFGEHSSGAISPRMSR